MIMRTGAPPDQIAAARAFAAEGTARLRERLARFVAIPSVSTDSAYVAGIGAAADFLASYLGEIGFAAVTRHETAGHPIITAERTAAEGAPTILVYGHYDVQPPDPTEAWRSPPFELTERDGRLYGRGVSDDKGPLLVALAAIEALIASDALGVNVRLLVEGEEELGSANLESFVTDHPDLVRADFVLSADGAMWRADLPTVTVGSRGMCALNVAVKGAAKDLHSGRYGGGVPNAIRILSRLLATLHDEAGAVAVPGFYDGIGPLSAAQRREIAALPFDEKAFLEGLGVPNGLGDGEAGYSFLERNWLRPTLEFNGVKGGYTGPGFKTVIASEAEAKVSCRLVPGQDPERILDLLESHLTALCPPSASIAFARKPGHAWPSTVRTGHAGLELAKDVLADLYGGPVREVRMGATIPIAEIFSRVMAMETVFFSFSTADEDYHAPNEFFRLARLADGVAAWISYLQRLPSRMAADAQGAAP